MLEFRLLGELEVLRDGRPLAIKGRRLRALLETLLLRVGEPVAREVLIDAVWGERPPSDAQGSLKVAVHRLRALIGDDVVATTATGYALRVDRAAVDVHRFHGFVAEGRSALASSRAVEAGVYLRAALALWRGRSADGSLEELRFAALLDRFDADFAAGGVATLPAEIEELLAEHPFCERLYRQLMLALHALGRDAEALAVYRRARRTLDEIGLAPTVALRRVERAILIAAAPLSGAELELRRVTELKWFWRRNHLREGAHVLSDALRAAPGAPPPLRAEALDALAWVFLGRCEWERARACGEEALSLWRELGDVAGAADAHLSLATEASNGSDTIRAEAHASAASMLVQEIAHPRLEAWVVFTAGLLALERCASDRAEPLFCRAAALYEQTSFARGAMLCAENRAEAVLERGDVDAADRLNRASLRGFHRGRDHSGLVAALSVRSLVAARGERYAAAAAAGGAAEALSDASGAAIPPLLQASLDEARVAAQRALGSRRAERVRLRAAAAPLEQTIAGLY